MLPIANAVVYTRIVINQFLGEVPFAPSIDMQILRKERSGNHAKPIVHEAGLVELSHPGIDYRNPVLPSRQSWKDSSSCFQAMPSY